MSTIRLSAKFQMVIPRETRDKMGLKKGQRLLVLEKNGIIHVIPVKNIKELAASAPQVQEKGLRDKHDRM